MQINKLVFKYFLIFLCPVVIIWGITYTVIIRSYRHNLTEKLIVEATADNTYTSAIIERRMQEIVENINVIKDSNEMLAYLNNSDSHNYEGLRNMLYRVMKNKEKYMKVSVLKEDGTVISRWSRSKERGAIFVDNSAKSKVKDIINDKKKLVKDNLYVTSLGSSDYSDQYGTYVSFIVPLYDSSLQQEVYLEVAFLRQHFINLILSENVVDASSVNILTANFRGYHLMNNLGEILPDDELKELDYGSVVRTLDNSEIYIDEINGSKYIFFDVLSQTKKNSDLFQERYWIVAQKIDLNEVFSFKSVVYRNYFIWAMLILAGLSACLFISIVIWDKIRDKNSQLVMTMQIADNSEEAILITDHETRITYVNPSYEKVTGYTGQEAIGKKTSEFKSGKYDSHFYKEMWKKIHKYGEWQGLIWDKKKNGLLYLKLLHIYAVHEKNEKTPRNYIGMFSDVMDKKAGADIYNTIEFDRSSHMLRKHNVLYELLNNSFIIENAGFQVISLQIENYNQLIKNLNSMDMDLANLLFSQLKDFINDGDMVIQRSSDQFFLFFKREGMTINPMTFANAVYKKLTQMVYYEQENFYLKIRIGSSCWPTDGKSVHEVVENSIFALDWANKNRMEDVVMFDDKMKEYLKKEAEIEYYLKTALEKKEFYLLYQPQIDIHSGKIIGVEALLRWENPVLGNVSPIAFIPIAERSRIIIEIGNWIIHQVCQDIKIMMNRISDLDPKFRCAINISAIQLEEGGFCEYLLEAVEQCQSSFPMIEVEVTESVMIKSLENGIKILDELRKRGIEVAIDDFGTGYSSLAYLQKMPVNKVKIDRSFIKDYPERDDGVLIRLLIDMIRKIGKTVLIEGVESEEQLAFLKSLGCDQIQGYYFSKPLGLSDFMNFSVPGSHLKTNG